MSSKPFTALRKTSAIQTSLFDFVLTPPAGREGEIVYINSLDFYELMPKYVFNSKYAMRRSGTEEYRTLSKVGFDFTMNDKAYRNIITPARITRTERNGTSTRSYDIDVYPGKREQVIEWAVRVAARRGAGTRLLDSHAGAEFTLYQLQRICAEAGHEMSGKQLREGLEVAMKCNIETVCVDGADSFTASSAIFPIGAIAERQHGGGTRTYVAFHPFVTAGIRSVTFRQIDLMKATSYPGCIDRWLYLKLMHSYSYADGVPGGQTFNLKASTIIAGSGAGPFTRQREGIAAVRRAMQRLHEGGDIEAHPAEKLHVGRNGAVTDVTFDIRGTRAFAKGMKASLAAARKVADRLSSWQTAKLEAKTEAERRIEAAKGRIS